MPHLLMLAPAPVIRLPDGRLRLDVKYVEGMRAHRDAWHGTLSGVVWEGAASVPFGADYAPEDLGFDLNVLPIGAHADAGQADLIAAPADMAEVLDLADGPVPVVFVVEYTIGTRLRIVGLDPQRSMARKAWSALWNLRMERRRRAAFRKAAGVQCNGYPAFDAYAGLNDRALLYLDGRMRRAMMATPAEIAAKAAYAGPLRIVHSGRLEPMKGAQDLMPIVKALQAAGVSFSLDIFGAGALAADLAQQAAGFDGAVRLHPPVDFETELVPWMRAHADLFLSCHRQADPSCTYLESLGCGVPVLGYDNAMWRRLSVTSGGGWSVPMADIGAMTERLSALAVRRAELHGATKSGLAFAHAHGFETEFSRRMDHFAQCLAAWRTVR